MGLGFECEKPIGVRYRGWLILGQRTDVLVAGKVIVEMKAVERLEPIHKAQVLSNLCRGLDVRPLCLQLFSARLMH